MIAHVSARFILFASRANTMSTLPVLPHLRMARLSLPCGFIKRHVTLWRDARSRKFNWSRQDWAMPPNVAIERDTRSSRKTLHTIHASCHAWRTGVPSGLCHLGAPSAPITDSASLVAHFPQAPWPSPLPFKMPAARDANMLTTRHRK